MYHVGSRMFAHQTRSVAASPYDNELALSLYGGGGLLLLNDFLEETLKVAADLESLSYGHSRNLIVGTQSHSVAIVDVRGATGSGYLACSLADRPTTLAMSRQDDFYIAAGSSEGSVHMLDMRMFNKPTATISPTVLGIRRISQIVCCSPGMWGLPRGSGNFYSNRAPCCCRAIVHFGWRAQLARADRRPVEWAAASGGDDVWRCGLYGSGICARAGPAVCAHRRWRPPRLY